MASYRQRGSLLRNETNNCPVQENDVSTPQPNACQIKLATGGKGIQFSEATPWFHATIVALSEYILGA